MKLETSNMSKDNRATIACIQSYSSIQNSYVFVCMVHINCNNDSNSTQCIQNCNSYLQFFDSCLLVCLLACCLTTMPKMGYDIITPVTNLLILLGFGNLEDMLKIKRHFV